MRAAIQMAPVANPATHHPDRLHATTDPLLDKVRARVLMRSPVTPPASPMPKRGGLPAAAAPMDKTVNLFTRWSISRPSAR